MLQGGLGNQLFQYVAGIYFSQITEISVTLDDRHIYQRNGTNKTDLYDFILTDKNMNYKMTNKACKVLQQNIDKILSKVPFANLIYSNLSKTIRPQNDGFDSEFAINSPNGKTVSGFFQSWRYCDAILNTSFDLKINLKSESTWLAKMKNEILMKKPIGIHIRRGDYVQLAETFGLLTPEYYTSVLRKLNFDLEKKEIWVFSDSFKDAEMTLKDVDGKLKFIYESESTSPAEVMVLMSMCETLIIANSTFSWWAAKLASSKCTVIAPNPWFKNHPVPHELIPPYWREFDADFE